MKSLKFLLALSALSTVSALVGCKFRNTDKLVAQVETEKIYQSDVDFLKRSAPRPYAEPGQEKAALENIIEARLIYLQSQKLIGDKASEVEQTMQNLHDRFLMRTYDEFYVAENLGHTDEALQKYFVANKSLFTKDSCQKVSECRGSVAKSLYLKENAEALKAYIQKAIDAQSIVTVEVAYVESSDTALVKKAEADFVSRTVALDQIQGLKRTDLRSNTREGILAIDSVYAALFGKDSLSVGEIRFAKGDTSSVVFKVLLRRMPEVLPEESRDSILADRFAYEYKSLMANSGDSVLQAKYKLRYEKILYPEVQKYYDEHIADFKGAPLDSVTIEIENKISGTGDLPLDPNYVLVTVNGGKPLVTEKDVEALRVELPERIRGEYPRRRRIRMLAGWKLKALAAREAGLENTDLFKKVQLSAKMSFYRKEFANYLQKTAFMAPADSVKAVFEKFGGAIFPGATLEQISGDMGVFALTPDKSFLYEYYREQDRLPKTNNLDSIKMLVYKGAASRFSRNWFERYRRDLYKRVNVTILDSLYLPRADLFSTSELVARADSLYAARNLKGAWLTWERINALSADEADSVFARSVWELARIDAEQDKFAESDKEYAAFCALWPDSKLAERGLFARAFQMRENLKKDSVALVLFQEFSKKYPNSDLYSSVQWLIQDIQSGGKLSEELNEKISQMEETTN
ncbi:MAG: hypothetical protein J6Z31_00375 [Fibrobacter sp.]|nr:hypothetical protein [Fibrobacter sp.]